MTSVDKAYLAIRDGILRGEFAPGSHLTAQELAIASGLSRTPVREAMRRLHAEGLVEFIPHRGAFVRLLEENEIHNIYELRVTLEGYAAAAAAQHATSAELEELNRLANDMRNLIEGQSLSIVEEVANKNNDFHKLIVTASHNSRLHAALAPIKELPLVLRTFRRYDLEALRRSANQHLEIVAAIDARDAEWARSVMASHILSAQHTLLRQAQNGGAESADPHSLA
jgi:DNA-binding GntR family transcriptional regulator